MPTSGSGLKPFCIGAGRIGEGGEKGKQGLNFTVVCHRGSLEFWPNCAITLSCNWVELQ